MIRKFYKLFAILFLSVSISLAACNSVDNGSTDLSSIASDEWDKLGGGGEGTTQEDADNEQTDSLSGSGNDILGEVSDEQKNTDYEAGQGIELQQAMTISEAGSYHLSGNIDGQIKITAEKVKLFLDNCNITNVGAKVIDSKQDIIIVLVEGSNNFISNIGTGAAEANAISGSKSITINGLGNLTIQSSKSAIKSDATFYGLGGNINIFAGTGHGISADTCIFQEIQVHIDGTAKDGIHAETEDSILAIDPVFNNSRGYVYVGANANITIKNIYGDGIQADTFVLIEGGLLNISSIPTFIKATSSDSCYKLSGGVYTKVAAENSANYSSLYQLAQSNKGIKVGEIDYIINDVEHLITADTNYSLIINDGEININTTDDGLHTNYGNLMINGGTVNIATSDDAIAADKNLKIAGGHINISQSYEGIEAETIDIIGGTIVLTATDDGINASSDASTTVQKTTCYIKISGGIIYVNSGGDGVDSNGGIHITGGELYVYGPSSGADAALDSETGIIIDGGIVIAAGSSGMVQTPATNSVQCSVSINLSATVSGEISINYGTTTIALFNPTAIFAITKNYQSIVISSPHFAIGNTYSIVSGSKTTAVTISSPITKIGTSSSGGGGPK